MKHKFEATICNYMPELRGEKYVDRYICYADFHVKFYRENTAVGGYNPPIEFFIQPEYDGDGKIVSMYGGPESDDDAELINPELENEIIDAMQAALDDCETEA